ncbi:MAG: hypothetical protein EBR40_02160 [Proteobacteria bacterium]|nr:hypothetical protein [Pseudomonadota bacterium]
MVKPWGDDNPMLIEFVMLGRKARHINAKSQREENTNGRRPARVLSAMKKKNTAIRMKMVGNATLRRMVEFMMI